MSFGFFGIQFGFALQNANVSRIFETLGASIDKIPLLWIAAPVTGLIVQPIIGHLSDNTWTRLGRRRPYFLSGALLATVALFVMPNSSALWIAAGMLWIMDASINISMEPFRAFVGDLLPPEQRTIGFSMQSFFIGTGAVIASALPYLMTNWLGISNVAPKGKIPDSVKFSFYIGGAVFFLSVLWTVISTKEYSPEEIENFDEQNKKKEDNSKESVQAKTFLKYGVVWFLSGIIFYALLTLFITMDYGLTVFFVGISVFGILQIVAGCLTRKNKTGNGFAIVMNDLYSMPKTMKQLALVQFFSWFALFAMWIYTTPAVTHHIFGARGTTGKLYNEGANWVGVLMAVYNGFAAVTAFALVWLSKKIGRKKVHTLSLTLGGLGLASFYLIKNPEILIISEIGIGIAWASILAIPYAILTGVLPQNKLGTYMGIFNFFIVIPQITAAAILGFLLRNIFDNQAIFALILGGISMVISAILILFVEDKDEFTEHKQTSR